MEEKDRAYIRALFPAIEEIQDPSIKEKVLLTWHRAWKQGNFPRLEDVHQFEPARTRIAYTNVEHTNQLWKACAKLAEFLAEGMGIKINRDDLIAGVILHDVDKPVIFDFHTGGFTTTGRRFAHAVWGATLAMMEGLPQSVAHIIGAHSFRFSPAPPHTVEALIVRHLDHVVAQSFYMAHGLDMERVLTESLARLK